jgi:hypothetical protein
VTKGKQVPDAEKNYFWPNNVILSIMRIMHFAVLSVLFIVPGLSAGQQSGIDAALQKGSAADLGVHFSKTVDISLPDGEDTYPPDRAVTVLSDFFATQTVKGYKRAHVSGEDAGRAKYTIGDLYTAKGTFRITLYYDTQQKITEVRIVK